MQQAPQGFSVWYLTAIGRVICLRWCRAPCIVCTTHFAAIVNTSTFQQYITTQRPPQARHRPSAAWASTKFPLAARSEFLLRAHHALGLASRVGLAPPMLSPSAVCVCALHLWETSGRLLGRTECHHAPNQWTPRLTQHPTHSRSQQFHHVVMHLCLKPGCTTLGMFSNSMYILPPLSALSLPGSQAIRST